MRLPAAMARHNGSKIATGATSAPKPLLPNASRNVCGIGPMRLIGLRPTKSEHGTRSQNEHQRDHWRGNQHRLSNSASCAAAFAGHDRNVFKSAERSDRHLTENGEAEPAHLRSFPWERCVVDGCACGDRPYRQT